METNYPRISEVRFWQGSATVELSDGVSMEADTDEQVQAIADASMHTLAEVRQAIDDARPTVESQR